MTREKVKHEYITDDSKRKVSFRKRKGSIMKKIRELSILCGVPAAAVVYSSPSDPQPEVWPDPEGARNVIERYRAKPLLLDKTLNQEAFIRQRINKEREHLKKRCKENYEQEINQLMLKYLGGQTQPNFSMQYAADMKTAIDQRLKLINMMMEASNKGVEDYVPSPPASEGLLITGENEKLMDQTLQYGKDPNKEVEFYFPAPPMSYGLPINGGNEKLSDQILQYGLDSDNLNNSPWWKNIDNMEEYMGFGVASDMPPPFSSGNYQNASSSYNPFSP